MSAAVDAITNGTSLDRSDSVAQVLAHRISRGRPHDAEADHPLPGTEIPADIPTTDAAALRALHERAASRVEQLGAQTAEQTPDWAVLALGPVPPAEEAAHRADWEHRAGVVAAHREAVGFAHPTRALDRMPGLSDGLIFDAVRIRLLEIGEAVEALPTDLLADEPGIPWSQIARMRDHLAHRYFDTSHAILQATVDHDLPQLEQAVRRLTQRLAEDD